VEWEPGVEPLVAAVAGRAGRPGAGWALARQELPEPPGSGSLPKPALNEIDQAPTTAYDRLHDEADGAART
jgi:hypothetical protein